MNNYLIIGTSSGIGKYVTGILIDEGNNVFSACRSTADKIDSRVVNHQQIDVEQEFSLENLPDVLDGIVYCPGTINLKPISRISDSDVISDFKIHALGAFSTIKQCINKLRKSEMPSIILFSTVAVGTGMPFHSTVSMSKGAVEGLAKSLAAEFAPKVRVNVIAPSLTDTPLASNLLSTEEKSKMIAERNPMKRNGDTEDIGEMVLYLLSNKAKWITGQIIRVDGGMSTLK